MISEKASSNSNHKSIGHQKPKVGIPDVPILCLKINNISIKLGKNAKAAIISETRARKLILAILFLEGVGTCSVIY